MTYWPLWLRMSARPKAPPIYQSGPAIHCRYPPWHHPYQAGRCNSYGIKVAQKWKTSTRAVPKGTGVVSKGQPEDQDLFSHVSPMRPSQTPASSKVPGYPGLLIVGWVLRILAFLILPAFVVWIVATGQGADNALLALTLSLLIATVLWGFGQIMAPLPDIARNSFRR